MILHKMIKMDQILTKLDLILHRIGELEKKMIKHRNTLEELLKTIEEIEKG